MGKLNSTGKPQTEDYNLGRGCIFIAELDATTGLPEQYRDVGNAPAFNISMDVEELVHRSSREGTSTVDKRIIVRQDVQLSFTLEELNGQNLALFFSGDNETPVNPAVAGIAEYQASASLATGVWYDLKTTAGQRAMDLQAAGDVTVVHDKAGANDTLVLDTDYEVDLKMGRIFLLSTGSTAVAGNTLHFTLAANAGAAATLDRTNALTTSQKEYALKFIGENPANADEQVEYEFHSTLVSAEGDFSLINENELTSMQLTGLAQRNSKQPGTSKVLTIQLPS